MARARGTSACIESMIETMIEEQKSRGNFSES
jgi:hypothetical protein